VIAPLAETIRARGFSAMVELVASGKREAQVLEIASDLATVPDIIAGSISSHGTGKAGDDPIRGAATVRARGLTPNVHLTCINRDGAHARKDLHILKALELHNVFALTGESPAGNGTAGFDSVQLTALIASMRADDGVPFHIAVAVSPFDYQGDALQREYARLEQKIANGADLVITQPGSDARQFAALKQQLDERKVTTPVLGNIHVADTGDGDAGATLGSAARLVAALKGLGYAGVYISGTHDAERIRQILDQAKTLN
jgi:5,10-methylenetetrahydrofolate reductase